MKKELYTGEGVKLLFMRGEKPPIIQYAEAAGGFKTGPVAEGVYLSDPIVIFLRRIDKEKRRRL